jgi:hypothetical protein
MITLFLVSISQSMTDDARPMCCGRAMQWIASLDGGYWRCTVSDHR